MTTLYLLFRRSEHPELHERCTNDGWNPYYTNAFSYVKGWEMAQDCLKEIEK